MIDNINDEKKQIKYRGHEIFNVENPFKEEEKNHGHQPTNLHYIG